LCILVSRRELRAGIERLLLEILLADERGDCQALWAGARDDDEGKKRRADGSPRSMSE